MFFPKNLKVLGLLFSLAALATPVLAHKVQVFKDVGATVHIEPSDMPRAGMLNLTWFALTRRGGQVIPLESCNCELAVYTQPYRLGNSPIAKPTLTAISTEGYQGIPSAEILFPRAGGYELVLRGRPVVSGDFTPFELRFPITVAR